MIIFIAGTCDILACIFIIWMILWLCAFICNHCYHESTSILDPLVYVFKYIFWSLAIYCFTIFMLYGIYLSIYKIELTL